MPIKEEEIIAVDAEQFKEMISASLKWLNEQKSFIDSLNVFPVPDGDTGTNMYLTFKEAAAKLEKNNSNKISDLTTALSKGALMGARGNSGVILSQLIRGFSQSLKDKKNMNAVDFANALKKASEVAYQGVLKPVEGTILTVSREAAEKAVAEVESDQNIIDLFEITIKAAQKSLKRTPELLDALKEAEVVDAGGQGFLTILEGMLKSLKGEEIESVAAAEEKGAKKSEIAEDIKFSYCTQLLIEINKRAFDLNELIDTIRADLQSYGDSIMVVGDDDVLKIHVHTNHPGVLLEYGLKKGKVFDIKIDNMKKQNEEKIRKENDPDFNHSQFHQDGDTAAKTEENNDNSIASDNLSESKVENQNLAVEKNIGVISVANGEGIVNILNELGVDCIIKGGQSMNPSTNDFLEAVEKIEADKIIILPNNKNIISAAKQVSDLSEKEIVIVETKSIPQAISALMVYDDDSELDELKRMMKEEMKYVKTLEITQAIKDSKVNGMEIKKDNYIGLRDGEILVTSATKKETVLELLKKTAESEELVTIYYGKTITESEAEEIKQIMIDKFEFDEIEIYSSGQPLYPFIISLEYDRMCLNKMIALVTDSTCDLPEKFLKEYSIEIVPLTVQFSDDSYIDKVDLENDEFYSMMESASQLPTTSQPSVGLFIDKYKELGQKYDQVISVHISSALSGTYEAANLAASQMDDDLEIEVVDSKLTSTGLGFLVLLAAKMIRNEAELEKIKKTIISEREKISVYFTVNELDYLEKGGRIGKAQAFFGNIFNFNPILELSPISGKITPKEKTRGYKKTNQKLVELTLAAAENSENINLAYLYGRENKNYEQFKKLLESKLKAQTNFDYKLFTNQIGTVLTSHTGPLVYGIVVYRGELLEL